MGAAGLYLCDANLCGEWLGVARGAGVHREVSRDIWEEERDLGIVG